MTIEQIDAMRNLSESAAKAMKSKRMLRILSGLDEAGFIDFDPFAGTASLTPVGDAVLRNAT
jgi:hypothetical protein